MAKMPHNHDFWKKKSNHSAIVQFPILVSGRYSERALDNVIDVETIIQVPLSGTKTALFIGPKIYAF